MEFSDDYTKHIDDIVELFSSTFTASEGSEEGALIGGLAKDLLTSTEPDDIYVFTAHENQILLGCIIFSCMTFEQDTRTVFVLAPVGVKTDMQNRGVGQQLLRHGIARLKKDGVDVALTYGDPNYYSKVGFQPIDTDFAQAPFALAYPHGWLGQPLSDKAFDPLKGASRCVAALNKPEYW